MDEQVPAVYIRLDGHQVQTIVDLLTWKVDEVQERARKDRTEMRAELEKGAEMRLKLEEALQDARKDGQ